MFPQQTVVYFARTPTLVKVGLTSRMAERLAQLRDEEPKMRLAAWLWGDAQAEAFVYERFESVRGREWLKRCPELDALISGLVARQGNQVSSLLYLYETLAPRSVVSECRVVLPVASLAEHRRKRAANSARETVKRVAEWAAEIRAAYPGEATP